MHPATLELMRDEVRAIFRAVTGKDMPEPETLEGAEAEAEAEVAVEDVASTFADLEAMARTIPEVVDRIAPFSFTPALDLVEEGDEAHIALAVPGVDRDDFVVEVRGAEVIVSGVRRRPEAFDVRACVHAEIPRGPFLRVVRLSAPVAGEPRVEVDRGLIRIEATTASRS